ncbi:MAG: glutathione S-transferase [Steroidobacterales bacterium]
MKIFYSATSPYVRKCLVAAHELGLRERIELVAAAPHPINRDQSVVARNPLGKIPTLVTDDGIVLYDSRVVCEYLDTLAGGSLFPAGGSARWTALVEQSLGDGILDAAVLMRYETFTRPENLRWPDWTAGQLDKVASGLAEIERRAGSFAARVDVGVISIGCALGYLDLRLTSLSWRDKHPAAAAWFGQFGARASMIATRPPV